MELRNGWENTRIIEPRDMWNGLMTPIVRRHARLEESEKMNQIFELIREFEEKNPPWVFHRFAPEGSHASTYMPPLPKDYFTMALDFDAAVATNVLTPVMKTERKELLRIIVPDWNTGGATLETWTVMFREK